MFHYCRSRGDETQIEEKLETPHVVSYETEVQIFFQPGEGGSKGGVVLPVREIGGVILALGFRPLLIRSSLWKF
jgi:hypothetical protein